MPRRPLTPRAIWVGLLIAGLCLPTSAVAATFDHAEANLTISPKIHCG